MTSLTSQQPQQMPQSSALPPKPDESQQAQHPEQQQGQGQGQGQSHRGSFAGAPKGAHTTSADPRVPPEPSEEVPPSTWWPDGVPGEVGSAPDTSHRGHGPEGDQHPQPDQSGTASIPPEQRGRKAPQQSRPAQGQDDR
jgi:hypothetical protein